MCALGQKSITQGLFFQPTLVIHFVFIPFCLILGSSLLYCASLDVSLMMDSQGPSIGSLQIEQSQWGSTISQRSETQNRDIEFSTLFFLWGLFYESNCPTVTLAPVRDASLQFPPSLVSHREHLTLLLPTGLSMTLFLIGWSLWVPRPQPWPSLYPVPVLMSSPFRVL